VVGEGGAFSIDVLLGAAVIAAMGAAALAAPTNRGFFFFGVVGVSPARCADTLVTAVQPVVFADHHRVSLDVLFSASRSWRPD